MKKETKQEYDPWKTIFFLVLLGSILLYVFIFTLSTTLSTFTYKPPTEKDRGTWVNLYFEHEDGTRVYKKMFVPYIGSGEPAFLTGVCSTVTKECRKPTRQEIQENRYIPQSSE